MEKIEQTLIDNKNRKIRKTTHITISISSEEILDIIGEYIKKEFGIDQEVEPYFYYTGYEREDGVAGIKLIYKKEE
jgi:hypothetical protein